VKYDLPSGGLATRPELRGAAGAIVLFGTIAALYFAREILVPFAFALTLTFLLTPVVALLQRLHTGRVVSVLTTLLVSIAVASSMGWIIAGQLVDVANQLPLYRQNIRAKIPNRAHISCTAAISGRDRSAVQRNEYPKAAPATE
jgi:predicted PurR-regulated permease PerM